MVSKKEFTDYYNGSKNAVCLKIGKVHKLEPPIDPFDKIDDFVIPQSFRYVNHNDFNLLKSIIPEFQNQKLITDQFNENMTLLKS